jgi:predicted DNA-binding transcriptional regulator
MTADRTSTDPDHPVGRRSPSRGVIAGAAIHPRFLRSGPWALSSVVALLFGLSFATSYAALYDYALELEFPREFAIAFPLVLDAVIVVLAVTLLLERALGRRTVAVMGWQLTVRLPTWPLIMLWVYFGGSVAGNVGHAPALLAAQLVAAVPPVSAALTFHLLLRLLDRAPTLRAIAEAHEDRAVDERERAAARKARRERLRAGLPGSPGNAGARFSGNGLSAGGGAPAGQGHSGNGPEPAAVANTEALRRRVLSAIENGERVTGETVGRWLGVSARTGRRRLAAVLEDSLSSAHTSTGG